MLKMKLEQSHGVKTEINLLKTPNTIKKPRVTAEWLPLVSYSIGTRFKSRVVSRQFIGSSGKMLELYLNLNHDRFILCICQF